MNKFLHAKNHIDANNELTARVKFVAPRFHPHSPAVYDAVTAVHDQGYFERLIRRGVGKELSKQEVRRIGLGWSQTLITRTLREVGGTMTAVELALE